MPAWARWSRSGGFTDGTTHERAPRSRTPGRPTFVPTLTRIQTIEPSRIAVVFVRHADDGDVAVRRRERAAEEGLERGFGLGGGSLGAPELPLDGRQVLRH